MVKKQFLFFANFKKRPFKFYFKISDWPFTKCIMCQSYNQRAPKVWEIQAHIVRGMGPRKLSTDSQRDGKHDSSKLNSTEQKKRREESRSAIGSTLCGLSCIGRDARVIFIYLYNKPLLPGPRLKLKLMYCIRPLWRIIYKNYYDVICKYLLVSIALNYRLAF